MPRIQDEHTDVVWQKVDAIVSLILENDKYLNPNRKSNLTKIVMEQFDVEERTAQRYIAFARKEIRKIGKEKKEKSFSKAIRDREFLFTKAKGVKNKNGDYIIEPDLKLALEIVKDREKLYGHYTEIIEHKGSIDLKPALLQKLTDQQLDILEGIISRKEDPKPFLMNIGINVDTN